MAAIKNIFLQPPDFHIGEMPFIKLAFSSISRGMKMYYLQPLSGLF
jgi:hypothetical protein